MKSKRMTRSLKFGLICSPVGLFVGALIWMIAIGEGYWIYLLYAPTAAFITSATCWYVLVEQTHLTTIRGVLAGCGGATLGHVAVFILNYAIINIQAIFDGSFFAPQNGIELIILEFKALPIQIIFSFIFFGWLTIPMGGYIGGSYAQKLEKAKT